VQQRKQQALKGLHPEQGRAGAGGGVQSCPAEAQVENRRDACHCRCETKCSACSGVHGQARLLRKQRSHVTLHAASRAAPKHQPVKRPASALDGSDEQHQTRPRTLGKKNPEQGGEEGKQRPSESARDDPNDDVRAALAASERDGSGGTVRSQAATPKEPSRHITSSTLQRQSMWRLFTSFHQRAPQPRLFAAASGAVSGQCSTERRAGVFCPTHLLLLLLPHTHTLSVTRQRPHSFQLRSMQFFSHRTTVKVQEVGSRVGMRCNPHYCCSFLCLR